MFKVEEGYRSRFGLVDFFDRILHQEVGIFARKNYRSWLKDTREDFEGELYILCLENIEELEGLAEKSSNLSKLKVDPQTLTPEELEGLVAKSFRTLVRTFFSWKLIRKQEEENGRKFMDLKNSNGMIRDEILFKAVEEADLSRTPELVIDFYNLRHLKRAEIVKKLAKKYNISTKMVNWRKNNWLYQQLNYKERELQFFEDDEEVNLPPTEGLQFERSVMTMGTFDLFHEGHENLLNHMTLFGGRLIIGVNSDEFTEAYKRKPSDSELQRSYNVGAYVMEHLDVELILFINSGWENQPQHILEYSPDVFCIGEDWKDPEVYGKQLYLGENAEEWFTKNEIELRYLPRTEGVSTTKLLEEKGKKNEK